MHKLPLQALSLPLRTLPDAVHAELLARLFNHLIQGQWAEDQLEELSGSRLALHITDTGNRLVFTVRDRRLVRLPAVADWDVCIAGTLDAFQLLATRREDPDTLFFDRRLALEGNVETGLYFKNMLDALDFDLDTHLRAVLGERLASPLGNALRRSGVEGRVRRLLEAI